MWGKEESGNEFKFLGCGFFIRRRAPVEEMSALTKYIDKQVLVITQDGRTILVRVIIAAKEWKLMELRWKLGRIKGIRSNDESNPLEQRGASLLDGGGRGGGAVRAVHRQRG